MVDSRYRRPGSEQPQGASATLAQLGTTFRVHSGIWWRLLHALLMLFAALALGLAVIAAIARPVVKAQFSTLGESTVGIVVLMSQVFVPALFLTVAVGLVWAGGIAHVADAAMSRQSSSLGRATLAAIRRLPSAVAVVGAWIGGTALALALTPLVSLFGVLGLVASPVVSKTRFAPRWPRPRVLVAVAVPLALPYLVFTRWSLALPAVWLDEVGARPALSRSWSRVKGRTGSVFAVYVAVFIVILAVSTGADALRLALLENEVSFAGMQLALQALVGPLPVVSMAVLYRSGEPRRYFESPAAGPRRGPSLGTAMLVSTGVLASSFVVMTAVPPPGEAQTATYDSRVELAIANPATGVPIGPPYAPGDYSLQIYVVPADNIGSELAPGGSVEVRVDGSLVENDYNITGCGYCSADYVTLTLGAGTRTIRVEYSGDDNFGPSTETLVVVVGVPSSVSLGVSSASSTFGAPLTFTANVSGSGATPTGTVRFSGPGIDGTVVALSAGAASLTSRSVPTSFFTSGGSHSFTATYLGDSTYQQSTSNSVQAAVSQADTVTSISSVSPPSPSAAGTDVAVSASVVTTTGVPAAGDLELWELGNGFVFLARSPLSNGTATLTGSLDPGSRTLWVSYLPPSTHPDTRASSTIRSHTVDPYTSTVTLTAPTSSVSGESVTLTGAVSAGSVATGSVEFWDTPTGDTASPLGTALLDGSGVARLSVSSLALGGHQLVARYSGDTAVGPGSSPAVSHTVGKAGVTVAVTATPSGPSFADSVTARVTVTPTAPATGTPTGTVSLLRGLVALGSATLDATGSGSVVFSASPTGNLALTAAYSGDARFGAGSASLELSVSKRATTTRLFGSTFRSGVYGDPQIFEGVVVADGSSVVPTGRVALYTSGGLVTTAAIDSTGAFTITTDEIPATSGSWNVWVSYLGSDDFSISTSGSVRLEMSKATSVPTLEIPSASPVVGDTVRLTATLANLGLGPTGTITFRTYTTVLGTGPVVNGTAAFDLLLAAATTRVYAEYSGDQNFDGGRSEDLVIRAGQSTTTVVLTGPSAPLLYGETTTLTATVTTSSGGPPGSVTFRVAGPGSPLAGPVPVVGGVAVLQVCGANSGGVCPPGVPTLLLGTHSIVAEVSATSISTAATSTPITVEVTGVRTFTSLTAGASTFPVGSVVRLSAQVAAVGTTAIPAGSVSFFSVASSEFGLRRKLGTVALVGGRASLEVVAGETINWPVTQVRAEFVPTNDLVFRSSSATTPLAVERFDTSSALRAAALGTELGPNTLAARLEAAGIPVGPTAAFTFTSEGQTCSAVAQSGDDSSAGAPSGDDSYVASCDLSFYTAGDHTFTVSYPGDAVFEPVTLGPLTFTLGKGTPALRPLAQGSRVEGDTQVVSWISPSSKATGTVTVTALPEGTVWCSVPVGDRSCSGSFGRAAALPGPASLFLTYTGDSNWYATYEVITVDVLGCYQIEVISRSVPAAGSISVDTPPNCSGAAGPGYVEATKINVSAVANFPYEFVGWERLNPDWVQYSSDPNSSFTVRDDFSSWSVAARFRLPCYAVRGAAQGSGYLQAVTDTNCAQDDGTRGYEWGTEAEFRPVGDRSAVTGESDIFYSFGPLPAGAVVTSFGALALVRFPVLAAETIPMTFGPPCWTVSPTISPAGTGEQITIETPQNCFSPYGDGHRSGTDVTLTAAPADSSLVLTEWAKDGQTDLTVGRSANATFTVRGADLAVEARFVRCYELDVGVDGASVMDREPDNWPWPWWFRVTSKPLGRVDIDVAPDCPDGVRYRDGTTVTVTPVVLLPETSFTGWCDGFCDDASTTLHRAGAVSPGIQANGLRSIVMTADLSTFAAFFNRSVCSSLRVIAPPGLAHLTVSGTALTNEEVGIVGFGGGCGPGSYYDWYKDYQINRLGLRQYDPRHPRDGSAPGTIMTTIVDPSSVLDVFATARGPGILDCWPLNCPDEFVSGDIEVYFFTCQRLDWTVEITRHEGWGGPYTISSRDDGTSPDGWQWVKSYPYEDECNGALPDGTSAWEPGTRTTLRRLAPADCYEFSGWGQVDNYIGAEFFTDGSGRQGFAQLHPLGAVVLADDSKPGLSAVARYTVYCGTLSLGSGVSAVSPQSCPGGDYVFGDIVEVVAEASRSGDNFGGFRGSVVAGTEWKDEFDRVHALVVIDKPAVSAWAVYPSSSEKFVSGLATAGKIFVGVAAVAVPVFAAVACPPCGLALSALTLAAFLGDKIPGTGGGFSAAADLLNPFSLAECASRWGFGKTSGTAAGTADLFVGIHAASVYRTGASVLISGWDQFARPGGVSPLATTGALAGLAGGLYFSGALETDVGYQTTSDLRSTAEWNKCVSEQYRAVT